MERLLDAAARQIGCDAIELRKRNFIAPSDMLPAALRGHDQ